MILEIYLLNSMQSFMNTFSLEIFKFTIGVYLELRRDLFDDFIERKLIRAALLELHLLKIEKNYLIYQSPQSGSPSFFLGNK